MGDIVGLDEDTYDINDIDLSQSFAASATAAGPSGGDFKMPPKNVPEPWQARLSDDGAEWYFINRITGERRSELPPKMDPVEDLALHSARLSLRTDLSAPTPSSRSHHRTSLPPLSQAIIDSERLKRQTVEASYKGPDEVTLGAMIFAVDQALRDIFDAVGSGAEAEQALGHPQDRLTSTNPALLEQRDEALHQLRAAVSKTTAAVRDLITSIGYVTLPPTSTSPQERDDFPNSPPWMGDMIKAQWSVSAALSKLVFSVHTASVAATSPNLPLPASDSDTWGDILRAAGKLRDVATQFPAEAAHIKAANGDRHMLDAGNTATGKPKTAAFSTSGGVGIYGSGNWGFGRSDPEDGKRWAVLDEAAAAEVDRLKTVIDSAVDSALSATSDEEIAKETLSLTRVVSRFKTTVGSIDIAAAIDLDGEDPTSNGGPSSTSNAYWQLVNRAQSTLASFEAASQTLVDSTACLHLALASRTGTGQDRKELLSLIASSTSNVVSGIRTLRRVAVDQDYAVSRGLARGHIGIRAYSSRSETSSRRSSKSSRRVTRPPSVISSMSRSSRLSKRSSMRARAVGLDEEFLDMDAKDQAQAAAEERDVFDHSIMYKAPAGSQSSLTGKGRSRSGSNAGGSNAGSDAGYAGGSVRSSSTAGLMKAMPFLRNRSQSDADQCKCLS